MPREQDTLCLGDDFAMASEEETSNSAHVLLLPDAYDTEGFNTRLSPGTKTPCQNAASATSQLPRMTSLNNQHDARRSTPTRVRAHLCDPDLPIKSLAVFVSMELRNESGHHLVISRGSQYLASFHLSALKMSRFWCTKSSTDRIVAMTVPDCDPEGKEAVYLKLDCYQSLDCLSRMTGFDLD